jgi:hypothetical protein
MSPQVGASARVEIEISRRNNVPVIPLAAVVSEGSSDVVYVREGSRIARFSLQAGPADDFVMEVPAEFLGREVAVLDSKPGNRQR